MSTPAAPVRLQNVIQYRLMTTLVDTIQCDCSPSRGRLPLTPHAQRPVADTPERVDQLVGPQLRGRDREHCLLVSLDTKNRVLAIDTVSVGSVDHTFMAPREVYRDALFRGAAAIVLAHNHPSGDPTPSPADRAITRRLTAAGVAIGVPLVDHLVIGDTHFTSMARQGQV